MLVVVGDFTLESCRRCLQLLRAEEEEEARALWAERVLGARAPFDLSTLSDDECVQYFRFRRDEIRQLAAALHLPVVVTVARSRVAAPREEALCIVLRRLAYPVRHADLAPMFSRSASALSEIGNFTTVWLAQHWGGLLQFDALGMSRNAARFALAVKQQSGDAADCVVGFIDGTGRAIARPVEGQRLVFSGHHRRHELSYQVVVSPDGLVRAAFGPIPGASLRRARAQLRPRSRPRRLKVEPPARLARLARTSGSRHDVYMLR